jgi:hypothetical protein
MESIQDPVVDSSEAHPNLMNTVPEIVGFRPAELMPKVLKAFKASKTLKGRYASRSPVARATISQRGNA